MDGQALDLLQKEEIEEGKSKGLNVALFADPKFLPAQMQEIRLGLENGIDARIYAKKE